MVIETTVDFDQYCMGCGDRMSAFKTRYVLLTCGIYCERCTDEEPIPTEDE